MLTCSKISIAPNRNFQRPNAQSSGACPYLASPQYPLDSCTTSVRTEPHHQSRNRRTCVPVHHLKKKKMLAPWTTNPATKHTRVKKLNGSTHAILRGLIT
jgi:hypothetical protein